MLGHVAAATSKVLGKYELKKNIWGGVDSTRVENTFIYRILCIIFGLTSNSVEIDPI